MSHGPPEEEKLQSNYRTGSTEWQNKIKIYNKEHMKKEEEEGKR